MLKRPRDIFDTPASSSPPYAKRVHLAASSTPSSAYSSPLKSLQTPLVPADSPTNPFSIRLNHIVTLPRAVSYTKYFALRFQLVSSPSSLKGTRSNKSSSRYRRQAIDSYRIVHVPPNYSFKLLYKLIRFLFDFEAGPDHVFEVQDGVEMYATLSNKPGRVKTGRTCVKLSRNFDDQLKRAGGGGRRKEDEKKECQWEGEDDYTLATAWPDGLVEERAIIYRHDSEQNVHIVMNMLKFPTRKGLGNRPFVFLAENADGAVDDYDYWNKGKNFDKFLRTSVEKMPEDEEDDDDDDLPQSVPMSGPSTPETPYPSAPLLQMRLESAHRRMSRKVPKLKGDLDDDEDSESDKEKAKEDTKKEQEHGEDWDPFGDEAEL